MNSGRPRPHNVFHQGARVAIKSQSPYASKDNVVVVDHDAGVLAYGANSLDGIAKPYTKMADNVAATNDATRGGRA